MYKKGARHHIRMSSVRPLMGNNDVQACPVAVNVVRGLVREDEGRMNGNKVTPAPTISPLTWPPAEPFYIPVNPLFIPHSPMLHCTFQPLLKPVFT